MNKKELKKLKNELMEPDWTENLHDSLKKLPSEDAKYIVESMDENEVFQKVNIRNFQQDYIADYLEYLWDISESSFWIHVKTTLNPQEGILWSDNMFYFRKMCEEKLSQDILESIVEFALNYDKNSKQDNEAISCVLKTQIEVFNQGDILDEFVKNSRVENRTENWKNILELTKGECKYTFI